MGYDNGFLLEILENLNIGIFVLDAGGNYLYVNETYSKLFDKPQSYFDEMSIPKLKEMGRLSTSVWEQVLQKGETVVALMTIDDERPDIYHHHFTSGMPTYNEDGSIRHIFYTVEPLNVINQRIQAGTLNKQYFTGGSDLLHTAEENIVAESPQMKQLLTLLATVSKTDASVLFTGPTGSGKQVLAEYTHRLSTRNEGPFVSIDCATIPENLLESELFGYEKGSFTGASSQGKKGQIELAHNGTLFLDEINSMPLALQAKLLRVLETKSVQRIGAHTGKAIDFRLICAANKSLAQMAEKGEFRSDLYYRISVVPIQVPPLRERKEDIMQLAFMFLQFFCNKYSCIKVLSESVLNALVNYDWPGNVRELRNCIERLVVTEPHTDLETATIPEWLLKSASEHTASIHKPVKMPPLLVQEEGFSFRSHMNHCEKQLMQQALVTHKTPAKVAEALKLDLSNVYRKLQKHCLQVQKSFGDD